MSEESLAIAALRKEYSTRGLRREQLAADPFSQFSHWFKEALQAELLEPNAMSLATANASGRVAVRTVLLKAFDERGMVFFTNYTSKKAQEMEQNAQAALLFPWIALERQVSISGRVEKIAKEESLAYFQSRPRGSRLGAWVSKQSSVIPSREFLEKRFQENEAMFKDRDVSLPEFWGGYRVIPDTIEFWQGSANRLHDRFLYMRQVDESWKIERLSP